MPGILDLDTYNRSLLFAKLSKYAYYNINSARKQAKKLGFTTIEFYDRDGAQAYRFQNKTDLVIACRGTQPTQYSDIQADLKAYPVIAETVSRVHHGFKAEVDDLWPMILEDVQRKANANKTVWFCGHSLGAAMATIMASRCYHCEGIPNPYELYTYGSPRVGWSKYCNSLGIRHIRWVNNNDIVTRVPLNIMGYKHHGMEHYLNTWGNVRKLTGWQRAKDRFRGLWRGIKEMKIDSFSDHSVDAYVEHIEKASKGMETPQV